MPTIASTHTISSRVKPRCAWLFIFCGGHVLDRNIRGDTAAALLAIGAIGHDVVRAAVSRRAIDVSVVPGIVGDVAALEIRTVPGGDTRRALDQGGQALRAGRKAAGIEEEQIERAAKTLQLDLRRLD